MAIGWRQENVSNSEIARRLGCGLDAIGRLFAKTEGKPKNFIPPRQKGSGRPRKFTTEALNDIQFHINREPTLTAGELKKTIPSLADKAERSVQHALQKYLKMPSRVMAMKPLLTSKMMVKRLKFAKKYAHWTPEDWSKMMYSDQSTFRCVRNIRKKVKPLGLQQVRHEVHGQDCEASRLCDGLGVFQYEFGERGHLLPSQECHDEQ